jgi:predicted MFS family arabinose efflux permease
VRPGFGPVLVVWAGWLVLMTGANLATPLYAVYAREFSFSSLVLTLVFATYAVVLVPSLIVCGRLSDRFGRRAAMLAGLGVGAVGLLVFAFAEGEAWLFAARALQGLAVGLMSGAATAALVELDPDGNRRRAAMFAGLAQAGGTAAGALLAGVLAEWAPDPLRLPFFVTLGATAAAAAATLTLRQPRRETEPWRIQAPRVPREIRSGFARVSLTAATVWGAVSLFFSIVPSYARGFLGTGNLALLAAVAAVVLLTSSVTQVAAQRRQPPPHLGQAGGLGVLAAGLVLLVVAAPLGSLALLLAGAVAAGAGHGLGYLSAQEELNHLAPGDRRGEVTAAFIACIYFLVATSVISTGLLDLWLSLSVAVGAVALALTACALATAAWQLGLRSHSVQTDRRGGDSGF